MAEIRPPDCRPYCAVFPLVRFDLQKAQAAWRAVKVFARRRRLKFSRPAAMRVFRGALESYGTFPLPEAQIDRFFMRLGLGYMTREEELSVLRREDTTDILRGINRVVTDEETAFIRSNYRAVHVSQEVAGYLMDLVEKTRQGNFSCGVSTRGAIALYKAVQASAALSGRDFVIPEDIRRMAPGVLSHRVTVGAGLKRADAEARLLQLIDQVPVPVERLP